MIIDTSVPDSIILLVNLCELYLQRNHICDDNLSMVATMSISCVCINFSDQTPMPESELILYLPPVIV